MTAHDSGWKWWLHLLLPAGLSPAALAPVSLAHAQLLTSARTRASASVSVYPDGAFPNLSAGIASALPLAAHVAGSGPGVGKAAIAAALLAAVEAALSALPCAAAAAVRAPASWLCGRGLVHL